MHNGKFKTHHGKFPCKTCKEEVKTIRVYIETGISTWLCQNKHLSEVELFKVGYKKKREHERKD
jgi:hypothetical protein